MSEFNANIVVQPFDITVTLDQPGITVTPTVTDLNIYAVGGTNGVPAGNVGDLQYYAANGFAAIPSNIANFTNSNLNFNVSNTKITGGINGYVLQTDGAGNVTWVAPSGSGNGVTGGSNTQVQFNDDGLFGGNAGFTFDKTTGQVNIGGNLIVAGGSITGNVANANYAAFAGNVTLASQPNITTVGNLLSLTVIGDSFTGPIYTSGVSGNITGANVIEANTFAANNLITSNIANITTLNATNASISNANITTETVGNANIANLQATTANVTTLTATGLVTLGSNANVKITGGSNTQVLTTDGAGNLRWTTPPAPVSTSIANGTSNVSIPSANGVVNVVVNNSNRIQVGSANTTVAGNLNVGTQLTANSANISGTVSATTLTVNGSGSANVIAVNTIYPIGNIPLANTSLGQSFQRFGNLWLQNDVNANGNVNANNVNFTSGISSNISPTTANSTSVTHKIPIQLGGVTYYIMLTDTP